MKAVFCAVLAVLMLHCAGCQSARELNELVIVMGIGIDNDKETAGNIRLTAQIVLPEKISTSQEGGMSSGSEGPYYNLESYANNTFEAVREYTHMVSGKLYIAHAQLFVIGREMAQQGIAPYLDFFVRARETRPTSKIVISETTASDAFGVKPEKDLLPATAIAKLVEGQAANSQSKEATLLDYIKAMQSGSSSLMAPIIRIDERDGEKAISVSGMAVFKKDKMVGEFNEYETRGVLWVLGEIQSTVVNVEIYDGIASLEVLGAQSSVSPVVSGGKVVMKIAVQVTANLSEQTCAENLATPDNIKQLQGLMGEQVCKEIVMAYNKAASYKADVFGFGEMIHKHDQTKWTEMNPNWDTLFPGITLEIKTDVSIKSAGTLERPVWEKKHEQ